MVIIKITISLLVTGLRKVLFSTNLLAKLLSDSLLLASLLSDSSISQSLSKTCACFCVFACSLRMVTPPLSVF